MRLSGPFGEQRCAVSAESAIAAADIVARKRPNPGVRAVGAPGVDAPILGGMRC